VTVEAPKYFDNEPLELRIYDMTGNKIEHLLNINLPYSIPITNLPEGIYLLSIRSKNGITASSRMIVRH
jgi:hypothetical protein